MTRTFNLLTISGIILLTSCMTMRSNIQSESIPKVKRILIVTKTRKPQPSYEADFRRNLPEGYEVCTINLDRLSLTSDDTIREEVLGCKSDAILTIATTYRGNLLVGDSNDTNSRPSTGAAQFNLEMRSATEKKPFWRAIISTTPILGEKLSARTIVRRLLRDGVLEGKLPNVQQSGPQGKIVSAN
ncbi:MAG: hypothetical protein EAZ91_21140 [Cytophagales bacterium]|nr:MAG: hypothetical protein EAZ91_21140 [Cytophagales bacterium]